VYSPPRARDRPGEIPDDRRGWHREHDIVTSRDTPAARPQPLLRISAVAAPTLLQLYEVLRLVDGLDGSHFC
jgi:hypothetical protein